MALEVSTKGRTWKFGPRQKPDRTKVCDGWKAVLAKKILRQ